MAEEQKNEALYEAIKTKRRPMPSRKSDKYLYDMSLTSGWHALKTEIIEPKIRALLIEADDVAAALEGKISVEQFGFKTLVNRIAAHHLQDIIDIVENTREVFEQLQQEKEEKKGGEKE